MKYFLGFLVAIALIIAVFILIVRGFGGKRPEVQTALIDYAKTETVVRMTIDGPVNAEQVHRAAIVTVGRSSSTIELSQGYQDTVLQTKSYDSNEDAYATFLRALDLQGYTKGDPNPDRQDGRGFCPNGSVYTFEIVTGSAVVQHFWTTSCRGGTFKGNTAIVRNLFRQQIPDYANILRGTMLN